MEYPYLLYFLFFLFGYVTCKTFYFLGSTRKSVLLLQTSQLVGLFILVRSLESFAYASKYRIDTMKENNASQQNIDAFKLRYEDELVMFKRKSIAQIIDAHGNFFNQVVDFDDWPTAMNHLEKNKQNLINFISQE